MSLSKQHQQQQQNELLTYIDKTFLEAFAEVVCKGIYILVIFQENKVLDTDPVSGVESSLHP